MTGPQSSPYQPLDSRRDCIRLIQLATTPPPGSDLLHCVLTTVSLQDITNDYAAFLRSHDEKTACRRRTTSLWRAQQADPSRSAEGSANETETLSAPSQTACRFRWGDYAALSYTWGSPKLSRQIMLNGVLTPVTENVETALRSLARTEAFAVDRHGVNYGLWVDALCIDQSDEAEKASQVAKMYSIYSNAWNVIVWLGEKEANSDLAFHLLREFATYSNDELSQLAHNAQTTTDPTLECAFHGLARLMMRPYWSRLWVVQEVVLGGSATILRCGDDQLDWRTFCAGIDVLFRRDMYLLKDKLLKRAQQRMVPTDIQVYWNAYNLHLVHKDLQVMNQYAEGNTDWLGFRRLLDIASYSQCRDARDKVYALLGMMHPSIACQISHSYSFSTSRIFAAISKAYMLHAGNLEPLREANPWGRAGGPSWAADWTWRGRRRYSRVESPTWGAWQMGDGNVKVDPATIYRAAREKPAKFDFVGHSLLQCSGFVFDRVVGLGARGIGHFKWDGASIVQPPSTWKSVYGGYTETAKAMVETLMLGRGAGASRLSERHSAIVSLPKTFKAAKPQFEERGWSWLASQEGYYFRWKLWRQTHDDIRLGEYSLSAFFTDEIPKQAQETDYNEVYGVFDRSCQERRFILTEKGRMGWGPDNIYGSDQDQMEPGDLLCILWGCSTPLVIRPAGSCGVFEIVGEAYVHGCMDGEALDLLDGVSCKETAFLFR